MSADLQPVTRNNWQEMIQLTEFPLDFSSRDVPLFFQIYQLFKEEILHNHIQYDDLLPSELLELGRSKQGGEGVWNVSILVSEKTSVSHRFTRLRNIKPAANPSRNSIISGSLVFVMSVFFCPSQLK